MTAQQPVKRAHARFSPSKLGNKEKCSRFEYRQYGEPGEANEAADEGELMHKAYETRDLSLLDNDEQVAQVEKCLEYADAIKASIKNCLELHEIKLEIVDYTYGYADHILVDLDTLEAHVLDAKFGRKGADDADNNVQIMCYCGGLLFGKVHYEEGATMGLVVPATGAVVRPVKVTGHIVAPRLNSATAMEYTAADESKILRRLDKILADVHDPFHTPKPDADLCPQCQWQAKCPALNKIVTQASVNMELMVPVTLNLETMASAPPETKSRIYALAQLVTGWAEEAKKTISKVIKETGEELPGYAWVSRAGSKSIQSTEEAVAMLEGMYPRGAILSAAKLSLPKLVDSVAEATGITKKEAKENVENALVSLIERGPDIKFLQKKRGTTEKQLLENVPQLAFPKEAMVDDE